MKDKDSEILLVKGQMFKEDKQIGFKSEFTLKNCHLGCIYQLYRKVLKNGLLTVDFKYSDGSETPLIFIGFAYLGENLVAINFTSEESWFIYDLNCGKKPLSINHSGKKFSSFTDISVSPKKEVTLSTDGEQFKFHPKTTERYVDVKLKVKYQSTTQLTDNIKCCGTAEGFILIGEDGEVIHLKDLGGNEYFILGGIEDVEYQQDKGCLVVRNRKRHCKHKNRYLVYDVKTLKLIGTRGSKEDLLSSITYE
ncbi:hypothetical protein ACFLY7_02550 [Patescibacteria group bacterium]